MLKLIAFHFLHEFYLCKDRHACKEESIVNNEILVWSKNDLKLF